MLKHEGTLLAAASGIVNYLGCAHRTTLDLVHLETPLEKAPDDEQMELVQEKGRAHEAAFLDALRAAGGLIEIADDASLDEKLERTRGAMRAGARVIYQAALREGRFVGHADFLRRVEGKSKLGDWLYEVLDTKLALKTKAKFLIQLACYSDLVAAAQGVLPERAHLALGDGTEVHFRVQDYAHYYRNVRDRFVGHLAARPRTARIMPDLPLAWDSQRGKTAHQRLVLAPGAGSRALQQWRWRIRCAGLRRRRARRQPENETGVDIGRSAADRDCLLRPHAARQDMRIRYDEKVDALYLRLDDSRVVESEEVKPGIVLDFNAKKQVVGIEVLDLKRRVSKADLKQLKVLVA